MTHIFHNNHKPHRFTRWLVSLFIGSVALSSCEVFEDEPIAALWMELDRDSVVLMLGDTCRLNMRFLPDTITNVTAYWELIDSTGVINVLQNGSVIATQVGEADVRVTTVNSRLEDACHVTVIDNWRELNETYPYDMIVYADVNVLDYHNDAEGLRIAAFINDEFRGYGEVRTDHDITYTMFRIWHSRPNSGKVRFRYYLPYDFATGELEFEMDFDGAVHGRLNNLISITQ